MNQSDVLIIGAGVAGCAAAITAADAGLEVTLLTNSRSPQHGSNTSWAQGGIIYKGLSDPPELLVKDVMAAGHGLVRRESAELLARRGPELVETLLVDRAAIPFDRKPDGSWDLTEEAAHSCPRILHVADYTGSAIADGLGRVVDSHPRIRVIPNTTAVDLITTGYQTSNPIDIYDVPRCLGAYVLMQNTGEVATFLARQVVLATGGLGQVFLHTTNPRLSRGDGIAMAYRAGARVINLEYIQFHPTAFYHRLAPRFLLSESLRGEGARLVNSDNDPFMKKYHPAGDLAPRDVVARGIHEEMLSTGDDCMYLDITHKDSAWVRDRFPLIQNFLQKWDLDLATNRIPVVPAAHYSCGGVAVDEWGRTSVRGLRAVGEVSCTGVHGANRLASTSILEGLVWGAQAGEDMVRACEGGLEMPDSANINPWQLESQLVDPALIAQDWITIKQTMWNYVGLIRTTRRMQRALRILRGLQFDVETFYRQAALTDELIGLRNGAQTALALIHQAIRNRTSRGTHFRQD